jgi:hypothetical protein
MNKKLLCSIGIATTAEDDDDYNESEDHEIVERLTKFESRHYFDYIYGSGTGG